MPSTKVCSNWKDRQGVEHQGCGQPIVWVNDQPLQQTGVNQWGKPQFKGRYQHMDGTSTRHDENNPIGSKAYQQTYAPQIEAEDQKEQARIQSAGFTDSKYGSMFESYMNKTIGQINESVGTLRKAADNLETKRTSDNVNIVGLSRSLDDVEKKLNNKLDNMLKIFEETAKALDSKGQKIDAFLAVHSFKGAEEMYQNNNPVEGEADTEENGDNGAEV